MKLTEQEKKELKQIIEDKGVQLIEDIETAKEDLKMIATSVKETYGVSTGKFNKMCVFAYAGNKEEEKTKALEIFNMYEELFKDVL